MGFSVSTHYEHYRVYGKIPEPDIIPSIPARMIITKESLRKNPGLILRKVTIPKAMPANNAGIREAANTTSCALTKPDIKRAMSEQTLANVKKAARLE